MHLHRFGAAITTKRRELLRFAGVEAACAIGFLLVYRVTVLTIPGRLVGDAALEGAALDNSTSGVVVYRVLDVITLTSLVGTMALVLLIALMRMRRDVGLAAVFVLVAANLSSRLLKAAVLQRPDLGLTEFGRVDHNSLPSGHGTAAFSIVVALLFVVPVAARTSTAAAGIVFTSAVALATMVAGWHRAGDSIASLLLVTMWAAIAGLGLIIFTRRPLAPSTGDAERQQSAPARRPFHRLLSVGILMIGTAAVLVIALATMPLLRRSVLGPPTAFATASILIVGTATALMVLVLWLLAQIPRESGEMNSRRTGQLSADDR